MLYDSRCASSTERLPWCTCDWVTWPKLQHSTRVPWLMFYKLPRGLCTTSMPTFPLCCMHSARDYSPQIQLHPRTMNSCRYECHLPNPRTLRKIQIKEGCISCSDLLAFAVCMLYKKTQHGSFYQWLIALCYSCVMSRPMIILEHLFLSLSVWLINLFAC